MKVEIIDIINIINKSYVKVNSLYGNFIGKWMNNDIPKNGTFDVEILFNKIINYEIIKEKYYIGNDDGKNIICGRIIKENEDYTQFLDINDEFIIMINIKENMLENKFIKLFIDEIELYPVFY